jgi:hypothetical protein
MKNEQLKTADQINREAGIIPIILERYPPKLRTIRIEDDSYPMGVRETIYLIFKDLYKTCPHSKGVNMCHCHACDQCMNRIKRKWLK